MYGYKKGFENIKNLVEYSLNLNVSNLTIFALSSENFNRSSVNVIYEIIYQNFSKTLEQLVKKNNVKIKIFGSRSNLPKKIVEIFENIENLSINNNSLKLNVAFNYGFKSEIANILKKIKSNKLNIDLDDENAISKLFYIGELPDPDLLIRTGGYKRLSNFIMYNLTYTELFFTSTLWPEFSEKEFKSIVDEYFRINRNYGL